MSEYFRTDTHQAVDRPMAMILDSLTGEPERFYRYSAVGPLDEAITYLQLHYRLSAGRMILIKLDAIAMIPL
jgi:hypothetical protein